MQGLAPDWASKVGTSDDSLSPSQAVPLNHFVFTQRFQLIFQFVFAQAAGLLLLHFLPGHRKPADNSSGTPDGVRFWFGLWLFLLGHFSHAPFVHLPSVPHDDGDCTAHAPCGSVVPLVTLLHVPFTPPVSAPEHA